MKGFPDLPPIWWLGSMAVIYLCKVVMPSAHMEAGVLTLVSWGLLLAALGVIGWSAVWFLRKSTPIEPHHTPKSLIVEGPYRVSRNPIYLALVTITLSSAIGNGSLIGLCAAAGLWWVLDRRFAAPEEELLKVTFGAQADAYLGRTRRWI